MSERDQSIQIIEQGKPWSLFPTLIMLALVGLAVSIVSTAVIYGFYLDQKRSDPSLTFAVYVTLVDLKNSLLIGATQIGGTVVAILLIVLFAWQKQGISISDYLALKRPKFKDFFVYLAVLFGFMVAIKMVSEGIGQDEKSSEFAINLVKNSNHFWLIFITVAVAAPLLEEVVMRGFLFKGLLHAKLTDVVSALMTGLVSVGVYYQVKNIFAVGHGVILAMAITIVLGLILYLFIYWFYRRFQSTRVLGAAGTILLTSLFWSLLHTQYGWFNLVVIFGLGVLFGIARLQTGSIFIPIALHASQNGLALIAVSAMLAEKAASAG